MARPGLVRQGSARLGESRLVRARPGGHGRDGPGQFGRGLSRPGRAGLG